MPKRVAVYCRTSTEDQNTDNQLLDLRNYVNQRGWSLDPAHEFVDGDASSTKKRGKLDVIMDLAHARKIDVVLVWAYDRFARSTLHLIKTLDYLEHLRVDFVSFQQSFLDTTSPHGRLLFELNAAYAQFERKMIVERTKAGLRRAVAQGKRLGHPPLPDTKAAEIRTAHHSLQQQLGRKPSFMELARHCGVAKSTVFKVLRPSTPVFNPQQIVAPFLDSAVVGS